MMVIGNSHHPLYFLYLTFLVHINSRENFSFKDLRLSQNGTLLKHAIFVYRVPQFMNKLSGVWFLIEKYN